MMHLAAQKDYSTVISQKERMWIDKVESEARAMLELQQSPHILGAYGAGWYKSSATLSSEHQYISSSLRGGVGAYALEAPQAVVQGVGEHVHPGIAPGDQLTVKPNQPIAVGEIRRCHLFTPSRALGPKVPPTFGGETRPDLRNLLRQRHYRGVVGAGIGALQGTAMTFGPQGQIAIPKERG